MKARLFTLLAVLQLFASAQTAQQVYDEAVKNYYNFQYTDAIAGFEQTKAYYAERGDKPKMLKSYYYLIMSHYERDETDVALDYLLDGSDIAMTTYGEESPEAGDFYIGYGKYYHATEEYDTAKMFYRSALELVDPVKSPLIYGEIYSNLGYTCDYKGEYDSALIFYKKAADIFEKKLGLYHAYTDWLYASMPYVANHSGNYKEEVEMAKKSLDIKLRLWGANTEEHYLAVTALAVGYEHFEAYQSSMEYFRQALSLAEKVYGLKTEEYATTLTSLGSAYGRLNLVDEGVKYNQQSYELRKKLLGEKHPLTLSALRNTGNIYYDGGRYQEALPYYQQNLDIHLKAFGKNAKELIQPLTDVAQVYENTGKIAEAETHYLRAHELMKKYNSDQMPYSFIALARVEQEKYNLKKSLDYLDEALLANLRYNSGDLETEAFIKNNIGTVYREKAEFKKALEYLNESLTIRKKIHGDRSPHITQTLSNLGNVYFEMHNLPKAEEQLQLILNIDIDYYGPEHPHIANDMTAIANVLSAQNKYRQEISFLEKAEKIYLKANGTNSPQLVNIYNNIAIAYDDLALYEKALEYLDKQKTVVLSIYGDNSKEMADCENLYGVVNVNLGNIQIAKKYFKSAEQKYKSTDSENILDVAAVSNNLGSMHLSLYEYAAARDYFEKALEIYKTNLGTHHPDYITTLMNLGLVEDGLYNYKKAIDIYEESLSLGQEGGKLDSIYVATINISKGITLTSMGEYAAAAKHYNASLNIYTKVYGENSPLLCPILTNVANVLLKQRQFAQAEELYKRAEKLYLINKTFTNIEGLSKVYLSLSELKQFQNKLPEALKYTELAKSTILGGSGEISSKAAYFLVQVQLVDISYLMYLQSKDQAYLNQASRYIKEADVLLTQSESQLISEQDQIEFSRWKTTFSFIAVKNSIELYRLTNDENYLSEAFYYSERSKSNVLLNAMKESRITNVAGVDQNLLNRERELKAIISKTEDQMFKSLSGTEENEEFKNQKALLFKLNREYEDVVTKLRANPKYQKLVNAQQLTDINYYRNNQMKINEAMIEYTVSDSTLIIFIVTKAKMGVVSKRFEERNELLVTAMRNAIILKSDQSFNAISSKLYDLVFKDVEDFFRDNNLNIELLTIVPEGSFNYFPFEALKRNNKYLVEDYEMSYSYSISLTSYLNSSTDYNKNNALLSFAPVFSDPGNSLITQGARDVFAASRSLSSGSDARGFSVNGQYITPLPGTKQEVEAIDELLESKGYQSETLIYDEAKEESIKSGILTKYQYIHFATHGFVNEAAPAYSGVFLSQNQSSKEDCILFASEIYGLDIKADLVTLSACETGLGRFALGEGIVGLTRAFIYAGAKNLLVSQWQVSDESTAKLMVDFYQHLLSGEGKTQSLREAKLALIKDPKFTQPYYWAPFVLIGQ